MWIAAVFLLVACGSLLPFWSLFHLWWTPPTVESAEVDSQNPFAPFYHAHKPSRAAEVMNPGPFTSFGDVFVYYFIGDFSWSWPEIAVFAMVVGFTVFASLKIAVNLFLS